MTRGEFDTDQTAIMRAALEIVVHRFQNPDSDMFRSEIASIVVSIAMDEDHDADTLAELTIEKLRRWKPSYRN
jgi:hypothetical protein